MARLPATRDPARLASPRDDVTLGGGMALGAGSPVMDLSAAPSNATPLQFYPRLLVVWPLAQSDVWPLAVRSSARWCSSQSGGVTLRGAALCGDAARGAVMQLSAVL